MSTKGVIGRLLIVFAFPVFLSILLNFIFPKPPPDHGKGSMFDMIATRYDFINRALALNMDISWRKVMIARVTSNGEIFSINDSNDQDDHNSSIRVLDLATGTADVAIIMAKEYQSIDAKTKKDMSILGLDPSRNMISVGQEKVTKANLNQYISLELGDARDLNQIQDNYFHAATMSFGIRNVPEKAEALCEIHRVLIKEQVGNKGGKLAILEFSEPRDAGILSTVARLFIRYVVPAVGALLSGAPREYMHLTESIENFPSPQEFVHLMEGLNCNQDGRGGAFRVDELQHLNFGSVQLYLATPIWKKKD